MQEATPAEVTSDHRSDLIRRMFAVVVSVGFAGALAQSNWIKAQEFPKGDEWQSLFCLGSGLVLILSSWEGFNRHRRKTDDSLLVFCIDLALVLLYLVVLLLSANSHALLRLVAIVFALYAVWDFVVFYKFRTPESVRRCTISGAWCCALLVLSYLANPYAKPVFAAAIIAVAAMWFRNRKLRSATGTLVGIVVVAGIHAVSWI